MNNTKLKTVKTALILITLQLLSACVPADVARVVDQPKAFEPSPSLEDDDQGTIAITTPTNFCVSEDLREVNSDPILAGPSVLWAMLYHQGVANRKANPMCLTEFAVTENGRTYIPCAVNDQAGGLYGHLWQDFDRNWIKDALEREASLEGLLADGTVVVSIEDINVGSRFYSTLGNRASSSGAARKSVVLSIASDVTFTGLCQ